MVAVLRGVAMHSDQTTGCAGPAQTRGYPQLDLKWPGRASATSGGQEEREHLRQIWLGFESQARARGVEAKLMAVLVWREGAWREGKQR